MKICAITTLVPILSGAGLLICRKAGLVPSDFKGIVISLDATQAETFNKTQNLWFPSDIFGNAPAGSRSSQFFIEPTNVLQEDEQFLLLYYSPNVSRAELDNSLNAVRASPARARILLTRYIEASEELMYMFDYHIVLDDKRSDVIPCKAFFRDIDLCEFKLGNQEISVNCTSGGSSISSECALAPRVYKSVFLGDWGAIGDGLSATSRRVNSQLFDSYIFGGDNIYEIGVASPRDPKLNETYLEHFHSVSVPQYVIEGNHDGFGNYLAQLLYTQHRPNNWVAPFYYFEKRIDIRGTKICFLFINTNQWFLSGQMAFIESVLGSEFCKSSDFITVAGHHPIFSAGGHGDDSTLKSSLLPLLRRYGVDLYISGHDHINSVHVDSDVCFVVSGAASKRTTSSWYTSTSQAGKTLYADMEIYSYTALEYQGERLSISLINSETGGVLFNHNITSKKSRRAADVSHTRADEGAVLGQRPWQSASIFLLIVSLVVSWAVGVLLIHYRTIGQSFYS